MGIFNTLFGEVDIFWSVKKALKRETKQNLRMGSLREKILFCLYYAGSKKTRSVQIKLLKSS